MLSLLHCGCPIPFPPPLYFQKTGWWGESTENSILQSVFNYFYIGANATEWCFFMGIEVPFFLAESPNYFWKLEKKFRESGSLLVMYSNVIFMYLGQWHCQSLLFIGFLGTQGWARRLGAGEGSHSQLAGILSWRDPYLQQPSLPGCLGLFPFRDNQAPLPSSPSFWFG